MSKANLDNVLDYLRRVVGPPSSDAGDQALLARFLDSRDQTAFAVLLKRHGPMVFRVCRRVLRSEHDAEDVVQAAFLLLARKAGGIRKRDSLGCWLHWVAHRLALRLKRQEMNRFKKEQQASALRPQTDSQHFASGEIQELLDTALQELPEKYRAAIIVCCLEGRTQEEAAKQLDCPLGTLQSRLARGRMLLQKQLERRGLTLSAAGLATFLTAQTTCAALPSKLFGTTLQAAIQYASGKSLSGLVSASVALLVNNGLKSIALTKMIWISVGIVSLGLLAGGTGMAAKYTQDGGRGTGQFKQVAKAQAQQESKPKSPEPIVEKPRTDHLGDPLPLGALHRLGTVRLRHGTLVWGLRFSLDDKTLLSADGFGVCVWDAATGKLLRKIGEHKDQWSLAHAAFANNGTMALATKEGNIDIMDATGRALCHVDADRFPYVALSPNGKVLAVLYSPGGRDTKILRLHDVITGKEGHQLIGHKDTIHSLVFSTDSKTLVTSSDDKSIRFWDVATGKQVRQLDHSTLVGDIVLSPDGKSLASVALIKTEHKEENGSSTSWMAAKHVVLWDLASGKETHRLEGHPNGAYPLVYTPDGKMFVSSDMKTTKWWDVATGKELPERRLRIGGVMVMAFAADGKTFAMGNYQGKVQLWDLTTGKEKLSLGGHQGWVQGVAISPDCRTLATGGGDNLIRLWDRETGAEIRKLAGHEGWILSLAFVPDGRKLVSAGSDGTVRVWEMATGKELQRFPGSEAALSPDGKYLATGTDYPKFLEVNANKFVRVWEISTGKELRKWPSTREYGAPLGLSSDGGIVYSWDADNKIRLLEIATGKVSRIFADPHFRANSQIGSWAFAPDCKLVAIESDQFGLGQIVLFDLATGTEKMSLKSHPGNLCTLAFSADGRMLATGDYKGGTVHLWEIATGQEFQAFAGHTGQAHKMAFSADGKLLLSGNSDTTALVWDLTGTRTGPKAQPLNAKDLEAAWSDLAGADATPGQKAVRTLLAVPEQGVTLLAKKLESAPEKLSTSQRLRTLRSVQVLEQVDTQASRELLIRLAEGVPEVLLTREAKAAVERLAKRRAIDR